MLSKNSATKLIIIIIQPWNPSTMTLNAFYNSLEVTVAGEW